MVSVTFIINYCTISNLFSNQYIGICGWISELYEWHKIFQSSFEVSSASCPRHALCERYKQDSCTQPLRCATQPGGTIHVEECESHRLGVVPCSNACGKVPRVLSVLAVCPSHSVTMCSDFDRQCHLPLQTCSVFLKTHVKFFSWPLKCIDFAAPVEFKSRLKHQVSWRNAIKE